MDTKLTRLEMQMLSDILHQELQQERDLIRESGGNRSQDRADMLVSLYNKLSFAWIHRKEI